MIERRVCLFAFNMTAKNFALLFLKCLKIEKLYDQKPGLQRHKFASLIVGVQLLCLLCCSGVYESNNKN